jgi:hypothetical protein
MKPPPIAFISYSWDSEEHIAWVVKLATDLRSMGIDVRLERWELRLGQDTAPFMRRAISNSDRVLVICTGKYLVKADDGTSGGVPYEASIISAEILQAIDTFKFVPVIRDQDEDAKIPGFLTGNRMYIDFRDDKKYQEKLIAGIVGRLSQADSKIFPALAMESRGDGFDTAQRPVRDAQYFALLGPTWGQIGQAGNADTSRQPTGDQGLDNVGSDKGQRDEHMVGTLAPLLTSDQRFRIGDLV